MNLLFKLLDPRQIIASFTLFVGGGGSPSGPSATSQTNTVSNIAPWAQAGVQQLIQSGLGNYFPQYGQELAAYNANPYDPVTNPTGVQAPTNLGSQAGYTPFDPTNPTNNTGMASAITAGKNSVASFQPLQNQSYSAASNMALPDQYGQATNLATQAGQGNLGTVANANQYGQAGYNAGMAYGQNAANQTDANGNVTASGTVQNYMNPYLNATLTPSLALINQQYGIQNAANNSQATQAGAFGGSRMGVQNALTNQAQNLAQNQLIGNAYNQAYNTANQNMQQAATLGMQGAATGLQGVSGQQAGYNGAGSQATNLGSLGTQQLAGQQSIAGLQNAYGAQQQQQVQNQINQGAQNYSTQQAVPMQQLQQLEGLYTGAPTSTTTSNYAAAPSMLSQVAGLGMAGYGLSQLGSNNSNSSNATPKGKEGGRINGYGIDKLSAKNLEDFKEGGITGHYDEHGVRRFDIGDFTGNDPVAGALSAQRRAKQKALNEQQQHNAAAISAMDAEGNINYRPSTIGPDPTAGATNQNVYSLQNKQPMFGTTPFGGTPSATPAAPATPAGTSGAPATSTTTTTPGISGPGLTNATPPGAPGLLGLSRPAVGGGNPAGGLAGINTNSYLNQLPNADTLMGKLNSHVGDLNTLADKMRPEREYMDFKDFKDQQKAAVGESPTKHIFERLDKQEGKDAEDKKDAVNYALIDAGLGSLAGTSPYWTVNLGEGLKAGMSDYKSTMKDLKAASLERDKMRDAAENADYAISRGNWSDYNKSIEDYKNRDAALKQAQLQVAGSLYGADENARATLLHGVTTAQAGILGQGLMANAHLQGVKMSTDAMSQYKLNPMMAQYDTLQKQALANLKDSPAYKYADPAKQQQVLQQEMISIANTNPYFSGIADQIGFSKKPAGSVYSLMPQQ